MDPRESGAFLRSRRMIPALTWLMRAIAEVPAALRNSMHSTLV
jgi:hypothetical protein